MNGMNNNFTMLTKNCVCVVVGFKAHLILVHDVVADVIKNVQGLFDTTFEPEEIEVVIDKAFKKSDIENMLAEFYKMLQMKSSVERITFNANCDIVDYIDTQLFINLCNDFDLGFKGMVPSYDNLNKLAGNMTISKLVFDVDSKSKPEDFDVNSVISAFVKDQVYSHAIELVLLGDIDIASVLEAVVDFKDNITRLTVSNCDDDVQKILEKFTKLEELTIVSYDLESLPTCLSNLVRLNKLDISRTQIHKDTYKLAIEINEKYGIPNVRLPLMNIQE